MYVREKLLKALKIKNVVVSIFAVFEIATSVAVMVSLITYYWGDWETVKYARATPDCVRWLIIGAVLLVWTVVSKKMIGDAYFYSAYFEGDLDGSIQYGELAGITGKRPLAVKRQMHIFRALYMKNYRFITTVYGVEQIELDSKTCACECRKCGAVIDKKIYFTGACAYCGSSDLFAKVLTNNRFYSISNQMGDQAKSAEFYKKRNLSGKRIFFALALALAASVIVIAGIACAEQISHYHDKAYLRRVLLSGKSYSSYALIKSEIVENIIWIIVLILAMLPALWTLGYRLRHIAAADSCARFFAKAKKPFVKVQGLPILKKRGNLRPRRIRLVKGAICRHYLVNCSFDKQGEELRVALARKIVRDECPSCGASIVGAADTNYRCRYCGNLIMDTVRKK